MTEAPIEAEAIAGLIRQELPEFAKVVDDYLNDWGDEPTIYLLAGNVFTALCDVPAGRERVLLSGRVYSFVDRMLTVGSKSVRDCFAIEFVEPLINPKSVESYPNFDAALGPEAKNVLIGMREWSRCYSYMTNVVKRLNSEAKTQVFTAVGVGAENEPLRVVANLNVWNSISRARSNALFQDLQDEWETISGHKKSVEVTGPASTNVQVLRSSQVGEA